MTRTTAERPLTPELRSVPKTTGPIHGFEWTTPSDRPDKWAEHKTQKETRTRNKELNKEQGIEQGMRNWKIHGRRKRNTTEGLKNIPGRRKVIKCVPYLFRFHEIGHISVVVRAAHLESRPGTVAVEARNDARSRLVLRHVQRLDLHTAADDFNQPFVAGNAETLQIKMQSAIPAAKKHTVLIQDKRVFSVRARFPFGVGIFTRKIGCPSGRLENFVERTALCPRWEQ